MLQLTKLRQIRLRTDNKLLRPGVGVLVADALLPNPGGGGGGGGGGAEPIIIGGGGGGCGIPPDVIAIGGGGGGGTLIGRPTAGGG